MTVQLTAIVAVSPEPTDIRSNPQFSLLPGFTPQPNVMCAGTAPKLKHIPQEISVHKRTMSEFSMLSPDSRNSGFRSPMRHHRRTPSARTIVKETLNARSDYSNTTHRINQYKLGSEIGRGVNGAVLRATDSEGREYAVKEFSKSRLRRRAQSQLLRARGPGHMLGPGRICHPMASPRVSIAKLDAPVSAADPLFLIREEIAVMKKLNHENLVQLIEVLDDLDGDSLYMVLEMCNRGVVQKFDENKKAKPLEEEQARLYFRDLILGIEYLHHQGIIHRDIKPDNLLLNEEDIMKIVDFGVSEMFSTSSNEDMKVSKDAGSPAFMAPELCQAKRGNVAGKAVDIWAMGVTLYCFRYGKIPFDEGNNILDMYQNICTQEVKLPEDECPEFVDLMKRILDKNPDTRIKMAELREHPWVTRCGEDTLLSVNENCSEIIEHPNELELSRALTKRTNNIILVMKVLHKLKTRVARRKTMEAEKASGTSTPSPTQDLTASNAQLAAEVSQLREQFRKKNRNRKHGPSLSIFMPVEDDLSGGQSVGSYLGIGTGSQYHVPRTDNDGDYVAESPTEISFDVAIKNSMVGQADKDRSQKIINRLARFEIEQEQQIKQASTKHTAEEAKTGYKTIRVDSGFEDGYSVLGLLQ